MDGDTEHRAKGRVVIFGEVLFDHFPDGARVLGGAPFNVAWHLCGFGHDPLFISRVGVDPEGGEILHRMGEWGMDRAGIQLDRDHPTGAVVVSFDQGEPSYEILESRAWDCIDEGEAMRALGRSGPVEMLVHGTLALRADASRATLGTLVDDAGVGVIVDVNLRDPWWSRENVAQSLRRARWAKLSEDELRTIGGSGDPVDVAASLRERSDLEALVVTLGENGAVCVTERGVFRSESRALGETVDTVGAGDAFTAVLTSGLLRGWDPGVTLERATRFAGEVCTRRGAISSDRDLYRQTLADWSHAP